MIIGYARTSTTDQTAGLAAQERDLTAAGAERIFSEQVSSVASRAGLTECLTFLRDGDVLAVTNRHRQEPAWGGDARHEQTTSSYASTGCWLQTAVRSKLPVVGAASWNMDDDNLEGA